MTSEALSPPVGVIEERRSSPGLLLALLGQDAMRRLRDAHTAHDLMPRQFQLLGLLADHGPMGQRDLGQAMATDPSILVTLLNPLEADGFVTRDRDAADRRRHVVSLTKAGEKELNRLRGIVTELDDGMLAPLTAAERKTLNGLLSKLAAAHDPRYATD